MLPEKGYGQGHSLRSFGYVCQVVVQVMPVSGVCIACWWSGLWRLARSKVLLAQGEKQVEAFRCRQVPAHHPTPWAVRQPFGKGSQVGGDHGQPRLQAGAEGVTVGFGPLGGEPHQMRLQPLQKFRQVLVFIGAVHCEVRAWLGLQVAVAVAQQVQFNRGLALGRLQRYGL